jgi:N-acetylmuramoyl-L-alanine amidase
MPSCGRSSPTSPPDVPAGGEPPPATPGRPAGQNDRVHRLAIGSAGQAVIDVQVRLSSLGYTVDPIEHGRFGLTTERAVREFQRRRHLVEDGVVEEQTWEELVEAGYALGDRVLYLRYPSFKGDDVRAMQAGLNLLGFDAGREDGIFGERTERAVQEFQRNVGLPLDGIVGVTTVEALRRLRPIGPGPGRSTVREAEQLRRLSATLTGARIAIEPGHGPGDPGVAGLHGLDEASVTYRVAQMLAAELRSRGASPFLLRAPDSNPPASVRARAANEAGAEVLVSVHLSADPDPRKRGATTAFYGREDWHSQGGRRLAELIQEELSGRLGIPDLGAHPRAIPILRETRMPAVQVEPCYLTNSRDATALVDEQFLRSLVAALAVAVERFLAGPGDAATESP